MTVYDQNQLDNIFFISQILCDSDEEIESLLKVAFPAYYSKEAHFESGTSLLIQFYRNLFEKDGAYMLPNSHSSLASLSDLRSLDPDFRILVVEKLFSLPPQKISNRDEFEKVFEERKEDIEALYSRRGQAIILRDWQREIVRPETKPLWLTIGPVAFFVIMIVYLIFRASP